MRWMSQYIARVLKGIVGHRLEVWKTEFGQWRRAHDTAEMVHELEEKETEILRLKTEIVERDAELYLVGTEEHLRDSTGSLRFGHGEQTSGIDEALQELVAEMVGEQAEEIARDAYFKAFELGPVADELYAEMVGECTEGVDYLNSVDLHSTVGREVGSSWHWAGMRLALIAPWCHGALWQALASLCHASGGGCVRPCSRQDIECHGLPDAVWCHARTSTTGSTLSLTCDTACDGACDGACDCTNWRDSRAWLVGLTVLA